MNKKTKFLSWKFLFCLQAIILLYSNQCSRHIDQRPPTSFSEYSAPLLLELSGDRKIAYKEVSDFLNKILEDYEITALAVAVTHERKTFLFSSGTNSMHPQKLINNDTIFQAGPLGQPVFASLILKLWSEGYINIDQPIYKYLKNTLPKYPEYEDLIRDKRFKRLTARKILSHQSGLPFSHDENQVNKLNFIRTPGKEFGYSIEGYRLLQLVVEKLTKRSINTLAKEKIFKPLGMRQSSFVWEERFVDNNALGADDARNLPNSQFIERASVGEFFLTTISDYAKFLNDRPWGGWPEVSINSKSIFSSQKTRGDIILPKRLSWTLGWGYYLHRRNYVIFHGGRDKNYENYACVFYSHKAPSSLVILSSTSNEKTFTKYVLEKFLGDSTAPLRWLCFENRHIEVKSNISKINIP